MSFSKKSLMFTVILATTVLSGACRSKKRGVRVGATAATLKVNIVQWAGAAELDKTNWVYQFFGCIDAVSGELEGNVVTFTAVGIKEGLEGCQMHVKDLQPSDDLMFQDEKGVLYRAEDLMIQRNAEGGLYADANLEKLFAMKIREGDPVIEISMEGLDSVDEDNSGYIYQISGCIETENGALEDDGLVRFRGEGLDTSKVCELRIKNLNPPLTIKFNQEKGVYYFAEVELEKKNDLLWTATAVMNKWYEIEDPKSDVEIRVETQMSPIKKGCPDGKKYDVETHTCIAEPS